MSSEFGNKIKLSIFGESHGEAIGCVIDSIPAGVKLDMKKMTDKICLYFVRRQFRSRLYSLPQLKMP